MQLTARAREIIQILIHFPQNHPVTVSAVSEELGVSIRSIQRELLTVEKWLNENGFHFIRKRSVGLMLDEPDDRKQELLILLQTNLPARISTDDRRQRQNLLCRLLLFADEPVKSYYLANKLEISEGTLLTDLNQISHWFEKYQLRLNRRQGLGIYIEGSETAIRQAAASCLLDQLTHSLQLEPGRSISDIWNSCPIQDITPSIIKNVGAILSDCEKQLNLHLSDNERLRLLIYLALAVHRIEKGCPIPDENSIFSQKSMEPEYAAADYITRLVRRCFKFPSAPGETVYLAAYLTGFHIWPSESRDLTRRRDFDIHQVTLEVIKKVGEELQQDFTGDSRLLKDLEGHLQPAIGRLRAGITIENPLLSEFQEKYTEIYNACENSMEILQKVFDIPAVYAGEVGFITIYFIMALERKEKLERKISAMLVCPSGIGSSRLLASNLKKEYPDLDIRGTMSAFEIDCDKLRRDRVDLVISTIKLSIPYQNLQVNPILTRQDKMLLNSKLSLLQKKKRQNAPEIKVPTPPLSKTDVEYISKLGTEIYRLLGNIRIGQAPVLGKRSEVISHAASLFAENAEMEKHFQQVLETRDQMADTYIKPFHALLLHGRSSMTDHICFGYVRLEPPVYDKTQIILGAIVSLIPEGTDSQVCAAITSEVIGALLEKPELLEALRSMDDNLFASLLEDTLLRFYRETVKNLLKLPAEPKKD